jgi:hypothetical protein
MSTKPRPATSNILGVSMPLELKLRIKRLAAAEDRTMAKWAAIKLRDIVDKLEAEAATPTLSMVAEEQGKIFSHSTPAAGASVSYPMGKRTRRKKDTG